MFHKGNIGKKAFSAAQNESKMPADSWEAPKTMADVQWALANMLEVYAQLWPLDGSVRVLLRVLVRYDYGAAFGSSERDRCRIIEDFCDKVMSENASRAARGAPFVSFEQAKNRWRDATEREVRHKPEFTPGATSTNNNSSSHSSRGNASGSRGASSRGATTGNRGGTSVRGRAGWQARNAVAMFNGDPVCFHYNNKPVAGRPVGCSRPLSGAGCDNGRGGTYAHVCNFLLPSGQFCLQAHPRHSNH